ncbi:hypothetical protein [Planomonospora venezuelensis]|uniref:Nitrate reductase NapE component n=1 Tax=Planomonospora venezuelensis TaxID=1999 RepID=A0A841D9A7_PLAVE|nr:hypothetical protein [Planomonospora venezuelensis]MBB5965074.1 nitrate reductase NapE component [Planomonospora venezuelensis]GIN05008.1 hypothetical protein Pve01_66660 [Planomonospora venezuelensis]
MPEHPLAAVYVLGAYGWLAVIAAALILRPYVADRLTPPGMSRGVFIALLLVAYSVFWPVMVVVFLAQIINERR